MSNKNKDFYTVRGYALLNNDTKSLTPSMEDYLEMCNRLSKEKGYTRISDLASALNVQPPSASNMVNKLSELEYLKYKKYGVVQLTDKGKTIGEYLLKRHDTIERFLKIIGVTENTLEQTEKIEHNISEKTLEQIRLLLDFLEKNPKYFTEFNQ